MQVMFTSRIPINHSRIPINHANFDQYVSLVFLGVLHEDIVVAIAIEHARVDQFELRLSFTISIT